MLFIPRDTCSDSIAKLFRACLLGNVNLFTKFLFTIFVPLDPPPPPNQQSDGFPLEFLLKGPQTELQTLRQNCEQTLQKLRTNRIVNKRAFLICVEYHRSIARYYVAKRGIAQMCLCVTKYQGGVSHHFGGVLTSLKKHRAIWGIAAIVSQYRAIWGH